MPPIRSQQIDMKSMELLNFGAFRWRAMNGIKDIILDAGGYIFGGFVRDSIRHDRAAAKYYAHQSEMHKMYGECYAEPNYADINNEPDTLDRLIVPRDIDVVFYNSVALEILKIKFRDSDDFKISKTLKIENDYLPLALKGFEHHKWIVTTKISPLLHSYLVREPAFELDLLVWNGEPGENTILEGLPPFGPKDFECNSLVMFQTHGQEVITMDNPYKFSALRQNDNIQRVIKNIKSKLAIFTHTQVCEHRVKKMLDKGFDVETHDTCIVNKAPPADNVCTICHEEIDGIHMKRKCCQALYHGRCLDKVLQQCKSCPQCRSSLKHCDNQKDRVLSRCAEIISTDEMTFGIPHGVSVCGSTSSSEGETAYEEDDGSEEDGSSQSSDTIIIPIPIPIPVPVIDLTHLSLMTNDAPTDANH